MLEAIYMSFYSSISKNKCFSFNERRLVWIITRGLLVIQ